jgi:hypothetical protein
VKLQLKSDKVHVIPFLPSLEQIIVDPGQVPGNFPGFYILSVEKASNPRMNGGRPLVKSALPPAEPFDETAWPGKGRCPILRDS